MAKLKSQKEKDLQELTEKLKGAKAVVMTGYRGTTVKDMDNFRNSLRKEKVFSKVYKIPLVKKAMEANGIDAATVDYKQPVIVSISQDDETVAARIIKNLAKDLKTFVLLEGLVDGKMLSKLEIMALADLPSKDQLRAQFMSVLNGPVSAFARVLNAYAEKLGKPADPTPAPAAEAPAAPVAEAAPVAA
jgi:large subunit ribosomal protein L10